MDKRNKEWLRSNVVKPVGYETKRSIFFYFCPKLKLVNYTN